MDSLAQKIDSLPAHPGVYLFKDERGELLYVGKAANLKPRVSSYFQRPAGKDLKTLAMLDRVADIETILTDTEKEALILEDNLIKLHHPRYNVKLRDDKNYPLLRLSVEDEFPVLTIVRRVKKDRSLYFGPYPSATSLRETLKLIQRLFPIRTSLDTKFTPRLRSCRKEDSERGLCPEVSDPAQYRQIVRQVRLFLGGKNEDLIEDLKKKMAEESERLNFEAAARIRDQIGHVEKVIERQKTVSHDFLDQDVVGFGPRGPAVVIYLLFVRGGKILGGRGFTFPPSELADEEIIGSFLRQYYRAGKFIPRQILIPRAIADQPVFEQWLTELRGKTVQILIPAKGEKKELLKMAEENAGKFPLSKIETEKERLMLLESLRKNLSLTRIPRRIEAFDISNLMGGNAVGSMVCFADGKPAKERYRHFKIRTVAGADDYGMMEEVLSRHYQKALAEDHLPDLVLLDGGRGQLNVAREVFKRLRIQGVDLLSLAKERMMEGAGREKTGEKIFHPQYGDPFILERHSPLLNFLDHIRDEAHRFAITYHKKVRGKGATQSLLEEIPGIGAVRQTGLLEYFKNVEKIKEATPAELARAPKMSRKAAEAVYQFFHPDKETSTKSQAPNNK
jgi:excinuclease ABC subunit C